jgi:hypothetical protein
MTASAVINVAVYSLITSYNLPSIPFIASLTAGPFIPKYLPISLLFWPLNIEILVNRILKVQPPDL